MTFRTLGDALSDALAQGMVVGEMAAATASQPKRTASAKPAAKSREAGSVPVSPPAYKVPASRWEYTATKAGAPHSEAVYCHLRVIEGGRTTKGRKLRRPAFRSSPEGEASKLVVVGGRDHAADLSKTGVSMRSRNS